MSASPVGTARDRAKADRSAALLREGARLFSAAGFDGVSIEDLGAAVGVTGPAVYRHFRGKRDLLAALLLRTSAQLLDGGRVCMTEHTDPQDRLRALIDFHVGFALDQSDVIRVQDRDLGRLAPEERHEVRRLQRAYVELWVDVLADLHPTAARERLRVQAHAGFGLINSTPHSVRGLRDAPDDATVRGILTDAALAALTMPVGRR
ncbi:TetR/AcrR family transcriptional regulator [Microbacterium sp.]|uniref:TetR/AcrR family transcriptional regulator n=1 Tax=Microbacterium sp. TaxID=51671 RepID=UPI003A87C2FF